VTFIEYYDAEVEGQLRILKQYHDFKVFAIYFLPVVGLSSRYQAFQEALEILDILRWEKSEGSATCSYLSVRSECLSVNVAQLEGFSPSNSVPHFLVLKGGSLLFSNSKRLD
jgi:hypothetical protein